MKNDTSTNAIPERSLARKMERRLIGMVMTIIACLLEKAVLRSIKRNRAKPSSPDNPAA